MEIEINILHIHCIENWKFMQIFFNLLHTYISSRLTDVGIRRADHATLSIRKSWH
jgi:hypothetical protein